MKTAQYRYDGGKTLRLSDIDPSSRQGLKNKQEGQSLLAENKQRMELWQDKLYAEGRQALLVVLQAMDAAGKDGTVKHVFGGVNPQGIEVANFKQPTGEELAHDYLWRVHRAVPRRGMIGVFNRSHYEDVLVGRVLDLPKSQALPKEALKNIWENRYRQIREFELYLHENGIRLVKIYLHLSEEEQRRRFLARLDDPAKNWKFEAGDLETRERWQQYRKAYTKAVNQTAAPHAPWYVVPADHKWYTRAVVSQIVADTLEDMRPAYPTVGEDARAGLEMYRATLQTEP